MATPFGVMVGFRDWEEKKVMNEEWRGIRMAWGKPKREEVVVESANRVGV